MAVSSLMMAVTKQNSVSALSHGPLRWGVLDQVIERPDSMVFHQSENRMRIAQALLYLDTRLTTIQERRPCFSELLEGVG